MPSRSIVFNWPSTNEFQKYDGSDQRDIFVAEPRGWWMFLMLWP